MSAVMLTTGYRFACKCSAARDANVANVASDHARVQSQKKSATAASVGAALLLAFSPNPPALAARVSSDFTNVEYKQVACEKGSNAIGVQGRVTCLEFSGDVQNPDKKNPINTADVFGRVFDKAGNGVTDIAENNRIAYVDYVPPGGARVTFSLAVPTQQYELGPLSWKGLKITGFTGKVLPGQAGLTGLIAGTDCSLVNEDSPSYEIEECENEALESAIR